MNKYFTMLTIGLALNSFFIAFMFLLPQTVRMLISKELQLTPTSPLLSQWANVSVPIYLRFYLYDVQNPYKVEFEGAKPILTERGPYTFLQKRKKKIRNFLNNGKQVVYKEYKYYFFDLKKSVGPLTDVLVVPNLPLLVMGHRATTDESEEAGLMYEVVKSLLEKLEPPMFENHTVGEMLFDGFKVPLFEEMTVLLKGFNMYVPDKLSEAMFGLMYKKNATHNQEWNVQTGVGETRAFLINSWNGSSTLPYWKKSWCNKINGTDGSGFRPWVEKNDVLEVFDPDICRTAKIVYSEMSQVKNIASYRFRLDDELFSPKISLNNKKKKKKGPKVSDECFCTRSRNDSGICQRYGVFDLSGCADGAPLVLSPPHFLDSDPAFLKDVIGLRPIKAAHETYMDIEPVSGGVINAVRRIQFNIEVKKNTLPGFEEVRNMLLPIAWIEESVVIDDAMASKLIKLRNLVHGGENGIVLGVIVLSIFCFINLAYYVSYKIKKATPAINLKDGQN